MQAGVQNWRRKLCRMQLKMWSWHSCQVVFWHQQCWSNMRTRRSDEVSIWVVEQNGYLSFGHQCLEKQCFRHNMCLVFWSVTQTHCIVGNTYTVFISGHIVGLHCGRPERAVIYTYWPWWSSLIISPLKFFVAIYTLLCGEKLSQKLCLWRKKDKYNVCTHTHHKEPRDQGTIYKKKAKLKTTFGF